MGSCLDKYLNPNTFGSEIIGIEISPFITNRVIDVFTVSEVAEEIHVTSQAIRKAISEGRLKARLQGKQYVIDSWDWELFKDRYGY